MGYWFAAFCVGVLGWKVAGWVPGEIGRSRVFRGVGAAMLAAFFVVFRPPVVDGVPGVHVDGVGKSEQSAGGGCECAAGAVCVGPKGGRYCLRPDGSKKYIGGGA